MSSPEEARLQTIIPGSASDFIFLFDSIKAGFIFTPEVNSFVAIRTDQETKESEVPDKFRLDFYENLSTSDKITDIRRGPAFASLRFTGEVFMISYSPKKVRQEIMSGKNLERGLLVHRVGQSRN